MPRSAAVPGFTKDLPFEDVFGVDMPSATAAAAALPCCVPLACPHLPPNAPAAEACQPPLLFATAFAYLAMCDSKRFSSLLVVSCPRRQFFERLSWRAERKVAAGRAARTQVDNQPLDEVCRPRRLQVNSDPFCDVRSERSWLVEVEVGFDRGRKSSWCRQVCSIRIGVESGE